MTFFKKLANKTPKYKLKFPTCVQAYKSACHEKYDENKPLKNIPKDSHQPTFVTQH